MPLQSLQSLEWCLSAHFLCGNDLLALRQRSSLTQETIAILSFYGKTVFYLVGPNLTDFHAASFCDCVLTGMIFAIYADLFLIDHEGELMYTSAVFTGDKASFLEIQRLHPGKEVWIMAITDVKEVFNRVPQTFNPNAAKNVNALFQFDITGQGGGNWNVLVKEGTCQVSEGKAAAPTVTLTMSAETWLAMVNKQINGMQAFMSGKLKVSGDIMLAQRIPDLFPF
jgi:putative sterol carrier protein